MTLSLPRLLKTTCCLRPVLRRLGAEEGVVEFVAVRGHDGDVQVADRLHVARLQPQAEVVLPPRLDGDLLHGAGVAGLVAGLEVLEAQRPLAAVLDLLVGEGGLAGAVHVIPAGRVVAFEGLEIAGGEQVGVVGRGLAVVDGERAVAHRDALGQVRVVLKDVVGVAERADHGDDLDAEVVGGLGDAAHVVEVARRPVAAAVGQAGELGVRDDDGGVAGLLGPLHQLDQAIGIVVDEEVGRGVDPQPRRLVGGRRAAGEGERQDRNQEERRFFHEWLWLHGLSAYSTAALPKAAALA